jgi:peptidoglycan/xylan/chitin deacetylase (PgdA/CDA1 family)
MTSASQAHVRLSVCLTFDFDAMSAWIGPLNSTSPVMISRGEFGAFAIPRILDLLRAHDVKGTFFVPGHTSLAYPELVRRIAREGHEVGHHGWVHENPADLDVDTERAVFGRALDALVSTAGKAPRGYRSSGADMSENTIDILLENDILYDSSCSATDFVPYYLRKGDRWSKSEPYVFGERTTLVELPFAWALNDWPLFEYTPGLGTDQSPPSVVREIWQGEFDYAYDHSPEGVFVLTMHPQVIGRGSRMMMLHALISHMKSRPGVEFSSLLAHAEQWKAANPLDSWRNRLKRGDARGAGETHSHPKPHSAHTHEVHT